MGFPKTECTNSQVKSHSEWSHYTLLLSSDYVTILGEAFPFDIDCFEGVKVQLSRLAVEVRVDLT